MYALAETFFVLLSLHFAQHITVVILAPAPAAVPANKPEKAPVKVEARPPPVAQTVTMSAAAMEAMKKAGGGR